jgi:small subunit ribosomal protein S1
MELTFEELFEQQINFNFLEGSNIDVEIIEINNNNVVVDFGFKSEGYINIEEFKDIFGSIKVKVGDNIKVLLESIDDGQGNSSLSYTKAIQEIAKENIIKSHKEEKHYIEVVGKKLVNKGFVADYFGLEVFIPLSLLDIKSKNDYSFLINEKFNVKVIKYDFDKNSVFASRKHYIEKELGISFEEEFAKLNVGSKVIGSVKTFVNYGAFIDLGFMDSLLHLNDISWKKINHANEVLKVNQELELIVSNIDRERKRLSVSLKDFDTTPWENFLNNKLNDIITVNISKIQKNGIIVCYDNSIDFFIHYTELSWYSIKDKIHEYFSLNQDIEVKITSIKHDIKDVKLNYRDNIRNPLIEFTKEHKEGDLLEVEISDTGDKFIKVIIKEGIFGYIFGEELSWNFDSHKELKNYKIGDFVKAEIKLIECSNNSIKLSIKNTIKNPFLEFIDLKKGTTINVTVIKNEKHFLIVETKNGARTLVKNNSQEKELLTGDLIDLKIKNSSENSLDLVF